MYIIYFKRDGNIGWLGGDIYEYQDIHLYPVLFVVNYSFVLEYSALSL